MKEIPTPVFYIVFWVWGFYMGQKLKGESVAELKRKIKIEDEDKKEREKLYDKFFESKEPPKRPDRFS